jgi:O2-independent ubiquinone biosynthesis protein UbiV
MSAAPSARARLSLGPLLFNWDAARRRDFYFRIADEAPLDIVYLGEVACSKRTVFFEQDRPAIVERLARAGKEVVHSTLALVTSERECCALEELAAEAGLMVEANDMAAVRSLGGRPHVIGPFVNVYNEGTLSYLKERGAVRAVLPAELPRDAVTALAKRANGVEIELQAFGRLPLALSARCYHARAHGLHKDGCQYVCGRDDDGMAVETLDGEGFVAVNGTQTLSITARSLLPELPPLSRAGADIFRLWPHAVDMAAVATLFRDVLDGRAEPAAAEERLAAAVPFAALSRALFEGVGVG